MASILSRVLQYGPAYVQVPLMRQQLGDMYLMREVVNTSSGHWQPLEAKCDKGKLGVPWASVWSGPDHIIFGHDHQRGLQVISMSSCYTTCLSYLLQHQVWKHLDTSLML